MTTSLPCKYSRRPLGWCKALDASLNRDVNQTLLNDISLVKVNREEAEDSFGPLEQLDKLGFVLVVCLDPRYAWERTVVGRVLMHHN